MSLGDEADEQTSALRAVAHPVRLQILSLLTGAAMSAAEIARELDITQANASYHVRVLARSGHVQEVGTESVRGGVAKKYAYLSEADRAARGGSGGSTFDPGDWQLQIEAIAQELRRRIRDRKPGGKGNITDAELWVTPEVWGKVASLVHEASALVHQEAQRPRAEGTIKVNMQAFLFEMNDDTKAAR
ncbi:ArsR/SmtB family transcription factor [Luteipulveratus halotolerans]|uniref:HTH arsR-type domain-containing protein n=1 Tax=Luteipulveratus halotolerans TaxID=1631356 RepID=A0A0L6CEQ8_9MICO|nr:helix-turn-helix domain-containing protein [Luteipulveratus halotolerans]KNX36050.1 hypothetical protein VV01_01005 [Luteipulveratus halotolerans]